MHLGPYGVPFFHRGQEFGLSKYGDMNSYRSSDKVNQFAYTLAHKRQNLVDYFKDLTRLRKDCRFLYETRPELIEQNLVFHDLDNGGLQIDILNTSQSSPYRSFSIYINISTSPLFIKLKEPQKVILNQVGYIEAKMDEYVQNIMIPKLATIVIGLRNEDEGSFVLN